MGKRDIIYDIDTSWHKKVMCEYCGFQMVVNNYEDRKSRTPKLFGLPICVQCDPRALGDRWDKDPRIVYPIKYRTCAAVMMVRYLSQARAGRLTDPVKAGEKLGEKIDKFWDNGKPVDQPEMTYEQDRKTYGPVNS